MLIGSGGLSPRLCLGEDTRVVFASNMVVAMI